MSRIEKAAETLRRWRLDPCSMVREEFAVEPDIWQRHALEAFASGDKDKVRISLNACAGPGKKMSNSTLVLTTKGVKKHGDLKPGDTIYAEDGTETKIVATAKWSEMDMYRITFSDGTVAEACGEHMWKVQSRHFSRFRDWNIVSTKEILDLEPTKIYPNKSPHETDRKVRRFRIPIQGALKFTEEDKDIELPIHPYLLGLWLGDGARNSGCITKDDDFPFKIIQKIGYKIKKYKKYSSSGQRYNIYGLKGSLNDLGVCNLYSGERYIPDIYKRSSSKQRKHLLQGLMDTEGRIKKNGMIDFHSTSKRLIEDITWLARSLGCYVSTNRKVDTHKDTSDCYSVCIRSSFNLFRIKRKANRWKKPPEHQLYRYIDSIEYIGKDSGKCIEIDHPSHCYLANDFIVTHNSAVLSWMGWNFLACYGRIGNHPKGVVISVTRDNLKDNLWPEFQKFRSVSEFFTNAFEWTKERIYAKDHPETWFLSARSWSKDADAETQGRTLSGIHSDYVLFLIDESGEIPLPVLKSAEQALGNTKFGKIVQAGNPTSHDGMLYAAYSTLRHLWHVICITGDPEDPNRSPRIDIEWAKEQIRTYGRDNPWVMSYILGKFPESSMNTLLGPEEVQAALGRHIKEDKYSFSQKRLGVDVARFGDDSTVIFPRQGLASFKPIQLRNKRSNEIAATVVHKKDDFGSELEFVDSTGGWGSGVVDSMIQAGHSPIEVNFSGSATDPRYYNLRAEMWFKMAEWIKRGGCLPDLPILIRELTAPQYYFQNGKFRLEEKDQIKKRLQFSPDYADALATTFALPDQAASMQSLTGIPDVNQHQSDYDPFA